jgi:hypothetical protein
MIDHRDTVTSAQQHLLTGRFVQLPHAKVSCKNKECNAKDAVYFQSQQRTAETGMVSFSTDIYGGDLGSHLAGHFLRVLRLPDCLVYASALQAQVLDLENAFEGEFEGLSNVMHRSCMMESRKAKSVTRVPV